MVGSRRPCDIRGKDRARKWRENGVRGNHVTEAIYNTAEMDLFSLYVLLSHFRARDISVGNSFFEMASYARAYVQITYEKTKTKIPLGTSRGLKWDNKTYKVKKNLVLSTELIM